MFSVLYRQVERNEQRKKLFLLSQTTRIDDVSNVMVKKMTSNSLKKKAMIVFLQHRNVMKISLTDLGRLEPFIDGEVEMLLESLSIRGHVRNIYLSLKDSKIIVTCHWNVEKHSERYKQGTFKKGEQHKFEIKSVEAGPHKAALTTTSGETLTFFHKSQKHALEGTAVFNWVERHENNPEKLLEGICATTENS
jgi:hypothetical protein